MGALISFAICTRRRIAIANDFQMAIRRLVQIANEIRAPITATGNAYLDDLLALHMLSIIRADLSSSAAGTPLVRRKARVSWHWSQRAGSVRRMIFTSSHRFIRSE